MRIAGAILAATGYILFVVARLQLGKSFSVSPQAKELFTHGLYSRIRNPIYVFVAVMWFGLIVALHLFSASFRPRRSFASPISSGISRTAQQTVRNLHG